jgi:hypothetical protein
VSALKFTAAYALDAAQVEWSAARRHNLAMREWIKCHLYFRRKLIAGDCSVRLDPAGETDQTGIIKFHGGSWRASKKYDVRIATDSFLSN